ncbi:MAG: ion transporter [Candidatus Marinimicrobia bacterium]|nr:ion transporter [Candidatus Neomarinimicrobiota bacterium]
MNIKNNIKTIIFGTDTPLGKLFDIILILLISLSILVVLLDSIGEFRNKYENILNITEVILTLIFTIEYMLRIYCIKKPFNYIFSFYGIIDLLAVIPTYLSLILPGTEVLVVIRVLRVLRVFRILKLAQYINEADLLIKALVASKRKIFIFLFVVMNVVIILGSVMYLIEGEKAGFTSIPRSIYWAIVTLTTVGYGDISPETNLGQSIAAIIMIIGYCIIAVPTGIVTAEINYFTSQENKKECIKCGEKELKQTSFYCNNCGIKLI